MKPESYIQTVIGILPSGNPHTMWINDYLIPESSTTKFIIGSAPESDDYWPSQMHLKRIYGKYVPHNTSGPAYTTNLPNENIHHFFVNGRNYTIDNMPIDNETKCMLKLKYTAHRNDINGFVLYT